MNNVSQLTLKSQSEEVRVCGEGNMVWNQIETEKRTKDKTDDPWAPGYKEISRLGNEAKLYLFPALLPGGTSTQEERETSFSKREYPGTTSADPVTMILLFYSEMAPSLRKKNLSWLPFIPESQLIWPELVFLKAAMVKIIKQQKIMNAYTQEPQGKSKGGVIYK